jgi:MscS family membrane protein
VTLRFAPDGSRRRLHLSRVHRLNVVIAVWLFAVSAAYSSAQLKKLPAPPPPKEQPSAPADLLGRENPRGAVMGLLKCMEQQNYGTAALYLQTPPGQQDLPQLVKELKALRPKFRGNPNLLTDDPQGVVESGLPPGQVRAGMWKVGDKNVPVILVRVDDPTAGKIWLISQESVAAVPGLYANLQQSSPTLAERIIPATLRRSQVGGMSVAQWLAWLLSIPLSWLLAWLLANLFSIPSWIRSKLQKRPFTTVWKSRVGLVLKCIIAISIHAFCVRLLAPPLLYSAYYYRLLAVLLVGCFLWLVSTIADRGYQHVANRMRAQKTGGESLVIVMQRLNHILLLLIAIFAALAITGVNVKTTLAGLGIGGLAIALAAQKSLENLIGGISLLMDKAIRVGDFCKIGDQMGIVEDIGLRSLKMRNLDQALTVVPNGSLAQMQFQNLARRTKMLILETFSLRIETSAEQLRSVLHRVQSMLDQHPAIEPKSCRLRVASFAGASFQMELFAYAKTGDGAEFTVIRQDVLLKIAEIVEASGTKVAAPTQLAYLSPDQGVDQDKLSDSPRSAPELGAKDVFPFPKKTRSGTD